jgi:hypothetical protein
LLGGLVIEGYIIGQGNVPTVHEWEWGLVCDFPQNTAAGSISDPERQDPKNHAVAVFYLR